MLGVGMISSQMGIGSLPVDGDQPRTGFFVFRKKGGGQQKRNVCFKFHVYYARKNGKKMFKAGLGVMLQVYHDQSA